MQHSSNHFQLATLAQAILNTLSSPQLAVHADYLHGMVTKVEALPKLQSRNMTGNCNDWL